MAASTFLLSITWIYYFVDYGQVSSIAVKNLPQVFEAFKVTVQFETEGSGQNEIFIHMDISEVKT